jgi:SAM-dependent methyltransferase
MPNRALGIVDQQSHWEKIYQQRASDQVSWYRPHLETSLEQIDRAGTGPSASIIDVGAGESTLVDDLLGRGYANLTVLDISRAAIDATRARLVAKSNRVNWLVADITRAQLPTSAFEVWHDRAVFHFLTAEADRRAYVRLVVGSVKRGGHVIIGAFGPEGPTRCSGLDVVRYDEKSLHAEFGPDFRLSFSSWHMHDTPFGTTQQFIYCHFVLQ